MFVIVPQMIVSIKFQFILMNINELLLEIYITNEEYEVLNPDSPLSITAKARENGSWRSWWSPREDQHKSVRWPLQKREVTITRAWWSPRGPWWSWWWPAPRASYTHVLERVSQGCILVKYRKFLWLECIVGQIIGRITCLRSTRNTC